MELSDSLAFVSVGVEIGGVSVIFVECICYCLV